MRAAVFAVATTLLAATAGCLGDEEDAAPAPGDPAFVRSPALDVDNRSAHGQMRSHNAGQNCMHCHQARGPGLGRFTVGVTVLGPDGKPHANPVLELYGACLLYTSPSPRDRTRSRMPSSA